MFRRSDLTPWAPRVVISALRRTAAAGSYWVLWAALTSAFYGTSWAAVSGRTLTLEDLASVKRLGSLAMSPDGKQIVVVTASVSYADNRFEQAMMLIDVVSGTQRTLQSGRTSLGSPRWSPRGDRLAWLDTDEGDQSQLYVMSVREPGAIPVRVTNTKTGIRTDSIGTEPYAWSPDGQSIAYVSADPKEERTGEERYNLSFEVTDNDYLASEAAATFHLWLVSASGGPPKQLTSGPESIAGLAWLPRSNTVLVISQPRAHNSALDFAEFMDASSFSTSLKAVDGDTGAQRIVVPAPGQIWGTPKVSAAGNLVAYAHFRGPEPWIHPREVATIGSSGGTVKVVTARLDRDIDEYEWVPGEHKLLVTAPDGPRWGLWLQSLDGTSRSLDLGPVMALSNLTVAREAGAVAFVGKTARSPGEIYVMTSVSTKPSRLTHFNESVEAMNLGRTDAVHWQLEGIQESGVLIYPPDFKPGEKYPLVLNIHGGPNDTSTQSFGFLNQTFAARGWVVFSPNYRGSNSQGDAFQSAVVGDMGEGPGRDVMAGLEAIKKLGFVDDGRIAVSGWSYGGYMTTWLIGHHPGWSSAVAGAPLTDLLDWYDLSCCNVWAKSVLNGSPWVNGNLMRYWRQSPIFYAGNITTPTLILQNKGDPEVPYTGSYSLYHALRDNGVPVKFVVYPLSGHGPSGEPIQERDTFRRWTAWIDEHFAATQPRH